MPHKRRSGRGDGSPPQTAHPIRFDALTKEGRPTSALHLQRRLERVDGREEDAECGSAVT
jgi:hypothetical protein